MHAQLNYALLWISDNKKVQILTFIINFKIQNVANLLKSNSPNNHLLFQQ